jgi:4-hydroxy-tetrahydrodipicolinate synthase
MHSQFRIQGIVPIIPTPFTREEAVDWEALPALIDFAHSAGACAVCLPAYASEFYKLNESERAGLISQAVRHSAGRIPVIAQVNSASPAQVVEAALVAVKAGAAAINVAVPRQFPLSEADLGRYFDRILGAVDLPFVIQDFNPGGPTMTPPFIADLHRAHANLRYVKLEEPLMGAKVQAILEATGGGVGVLEGWGGMYMMDLIPLGISGVLPGLGMTDLLARIYNLALSGAREEAYEIFGAVLPWIVYSLQNLELFHHAEKRLLQARGVLRNPVVRESTVAVRPHEAEYLDFLHGRILALLDKLNMPHRPQTSPTGQAAKI